MTDGGKEVRFDELWFEVAEPASEAEMQTAEELWTWRTIDAELAELTHQASADAELTGVRDDRRVTTLSFEAEDLVIEVEVDEETHLLTGQFVPPMTGEVVLMRPQTSSEQRAITDSAGVFRFPAGQSGPGQLLISLDDGRRLRTEWTVF
jgi:hypothetical protein